MAILGFTMLIFGILGQGVFQGSLHFHCATPDEYNLYLKDLEEEGEHRRRAVDFRGASNGQTPRFWAEETGRGIYEPSVSILDAEADVETEGALNNASGQEPAQTWYVLPTDADDEWRTDVPDGEISDKEPEPQGLMSGGGRVASGRALKGGGGGSASYASVTRYPPPPPPPVGVPVAPDPPPPPPLDLSSIVCDDEAHFEDEGYMEKCCPDFHFVGQRRRSLQEQRRPGRRLKGGGGGGGVSGPSDPCNPTFGAEDGPFCDPGNPDSCPAPAECLFFPEAVTLNDFDSVLNAGMVISQIVTLDTWSASMYGVMAAFAAPTVVWIYYLINVAIGGFFIINLFLGM